MTKKELDILERALEAEIFGAMSKIKGSHLLQSKSKTAKKLETEGCLEYQVIHDGWFKYEGYVLTHKGRIEYLTSGRIWKGKGA